MRYHNTPEGPRPCHAHLRPCPLEGGDFPSEEAAVAQFTGELPTFHLTAATEEVVRRLAAAGVQPLVVGGSVRDYLLGHDGKDVDLELYGSKPDGSSLSFSDLTPLFSRRQGFRMDEAGASFSVLKLRYQGEDFDLALPRTELSTGEGHRDYQVMHDSTMPFEEASTRRDFTINSMAMDPLDHSLKDPHGGLEDLSAGRLRHISAAFSDDPLRCLRGMSFAARFNFTMAPETLQLCQQLAPSYPSLAHERVTEEFHKFSSKGKALQQGLLVLHDSGWARPMPGLGTASREELQQWGRALNAAPKDLRLPLLAEMATRAGHQDPQAFLEPSMVGRRRGTALRDLLNSPGKAETMANYRRCVKEGYTLPQLQAAAGVMGQGDTLQDLPATPPEPLLTGKLLQERGFRSGPEMGRLLKTAQRLQDEEGITSPEILLSRALREG